MRRRNILAAALLALLPVLVVCRAESQDVEYIRALGSAPSAAFRTYELVRDLDGIAYLPRVTAEEMPPNRGAAGETPQ